MSKSVTKPEDSLKLTLEAWSQGFMVGALVIMCGITLANMRGGVLLHKLILIELLLAVPNGFFIFFDPPVWGWYLFSTVVPLITSWTLHNIVAWMKNKPFLDRRGSRLYIGSVLLVQPYWVLEIYANFAYFNGINRRLFIATRPYEALFRDPWWIFTIVNLFWNIKFRYELGFVDIMKVSPRFTTLLFCMVLSVIFIVIDLLSVTQVIPIGSINPFWKFAFVFKCFTDSIILDDFKTALDKLSRHKMNRILPFNIAMDNSWAQGPGTAQPNHKSTKRRRHSLDMGSVREVELVHSANSSREMLSDGGGLSSPSPAILSPASGDATK